MPKAPGEDAGRLRGFRAGAAFGLPRFYLGTKEQVLGGVPVRKVLFAAAIVTFLAQTAFGALIMDRGLPAQTTAYGWHGNIDEGSWNNINMLQSADFDYKDCEANPSTFGTPTFTGGDFFRSRRRPAPTM